MNEVISVVASSTGFMNQGAGVLWTPGGGPSWIDCPLGQAQSSATAVWSVAGSGDPIPPGQVLQSVRFDGQHSYIVDLGGPTKTRQCSPYGGAGIAPTGVGGFARLGTAIGTGNGAPINFAVDVHTLGITSTHYNTDQLFVGVNASTNGADSFYAGLYHFEALNWTLYFGTPPPPTGGTAPAGHFTNPIGNTSPGKMAGIEQFASVTFTIDQPSYTPTMHWQWVLKGSSGMLFSNGTRFLDQNMGSNTPSGRVNSCGPISIPAGLAPGQYPLTMNVTNITGGADPNSLTMTTYLTVRTLGGVFMEA